MTVPRFLPTWLGGDASHVDGQQPPAARVEDVGAERRECGATSDDGKVCRRLCAPGSDVHGGGHWFADPVIPGDMVRRETAHWIVGVPIELGDHRPMVRALKGAEARVEDVGARMILPPGPEWTPLQPHVRTALAAERVRRVVEDPWPASDPLGIRAARVETHAAIARSMLLGEPWPFVTILPDD